TKQTSSTGAQSALQADIDVTQVLHVTRPFLFFSNHHDAYFLLLVLQPPSTRNAPPPIVPLPTGALMLRSQRGKEIRYSIGQKPVFSNTQNHKFRIATSPLTRWGGLNKLLESHLSSNEIWSVEDRDTMNITALSMV
ncbi:hypothetical protein WG66_011397, partial [Moniliophthora roreri]